MIRHNDMRSMGNGRIELRIDVAPGGVGEDLDMVGERNADWNARVLTVMARSGMVRLVGQRREQETDKTFIVVQTLIEGLDNREAWESFEQLRHDIRENNRESLAAMLKYLKGKTCPQELLRSCYTITWNGQTHVPSRDCGGCPTCGARPLGVAPPIDFPVPVMPWGAPICLDETLSSLMDAMSHSLVVYYPADKFDNKGFRQDLHTLLHLLSHRGMRSLFWLADRESRFPEELLSFAKFTPYFVSIGSHWITRQLPDGPAIVFIAPNWKTELDPPTASLGNERLMFIPDTMLSPTTGQKLNECYNGADMKFEVFRIRMLT